MKLVKDKIKIGELRILAKSKFGDMVKAVVDTEEEIMVIDGELHADEEALLIEKGSKQEDLWGINIYPDVAGNDWIEFDSMINLKPSQGNKNRGVDDPNTRQKIIEIVYKLVER